MARGGNGRSPPSARWRLATLSPRGEWRKYLAGRRPPARARRRRHRSGTSRTSRQPLQGGGLYLLWLGVQALRSTGGSITPRDGAAPPRAPLRCLSAKGLVASAINRKVVLFLLALPPQFVEGARGVGWQAAQLGGVFTALGLRLLFTR